MRPNQTSILARTVLAIILVAGLSACIIAPRHGYHEGPPHHAPAHGYYSYWYYPDVEVYFDINRELYFYFDAGRWISVTVLPPHLHRHLGRYVDLRMKNARPWHEHRHHKRSYPGRDGRHERRDDRILRHKHRENAKDAGRQSWGQRKDHRETKKEHRQDRRDHRKDHREERTDHRRSYRQEQKGQRKDRREDRRAKRRYDDEPENNGKGKIKRKDRDLDD